jgi:hypothetical protein
MKKRRTHSRFLKYWKLVDKQLKKKQRRTMGIGHKNNQRKIDIKH